MAEHRSIILNSLQEQGHREGVTVRVENSNPQIQGLNNEERRNRIETIRRPIDENYETLKNTIRANEDLSAENKRLNED